MKLKKDEPHLKEVFDLYDKVKKFADSVELEGDYSVIDGDSRRYAEQDVDAVVEAFSREFGVSPDESDSIRSAISGVETDFMDLKDRRDAPDDELFPILYILSRPFFRSIKSSLDMDDIQWEEGKCAVCGATPSISVMETESPRKYSCSFCGSQGKYKRIGCPNCQTEDAKMIDLVYLQDSDEIRVDLCSSCNSYTKTFEAGLLAEHSIEELDLLSLPYDIIAQNKGFKRMSPNPIGIIRMTG